MTARYNYMTNALREDGQRVEIAALDQQDARDHRYYCADCKTDHNRTVELVIVHGHAHNYEREKIDPRLGQPIMTNKGAPVSASKTVWQPSHFKRAPGAQKHACGHDVAFSAFRSTALYLNAREIDRATRAHLFPLMAPRHGAFEQDEPIGPAGAAPSFRPKGMRSAGVRDAKDFAKLLDHFEDHAGLQHYQFFQDKERARRAFTEVHFEDGKALFDYLDRHDVVGRDQAILCSYVMNPNTSVQARAKVPEGDGLIDRDVSRMTDGRKLNIFARGTNRQSIDALSTAAFQNGVFGKSLIQVFGQCWIEDTYLDEKCHRVEIEIYDPRQVSPWNRKGGFVPPYDPRLGDNDLVLAL